jgi:phosphohistidine phosphatase SixA
VVCTSQAQSTAPDRSVVEKLQKGGYVLFLRHFQTNPDQGDTDPYHPENISAQRQLTDTGRAQATAVGQAFRALGIPIGTVVCSPFQRARESAELIAAGEPTTNMDVSESRWVKTPEEKQRRAEALRRLLSTQPAPGKNNLIVSHSPNLQDAAGDGVTDVGEGEVLVFQPTGDGQFRLIARIYPPSTWTEWSKATK